MTIRSVLKAGLPPDEQGKRRIAYYDNVGTGFGPRIAVIQDIDGAEVVFGGTSTNPARDFGIPAKAVTKVIRVPCPRR